MDENKPQQTQGSNPPFDPEAQTELENFIKREMHLACNTFSEMVDSVSMYMIDNSLSTTDDEAAQRAEELLLPYWSAALTEEMSWPETTDGDKLTRAFMALEKREIISRMHWTCCQTCGVSEIGSCADDDTVGYVFFHEQDTDNLLDAGYLHLRYGSFTKSPTKNEAVGRMIVGSLRKAGLRPQWDGNPKTSITLEGLDWKKRLPTDELEENEENGETEDAE